MSEVPPPESLATAARVLFADRLPLAQRYADLLVTDGVVRGLIGPREAPRIWDRHLLNSVAVMEMVPDNVTVVDVGTGAGLPGIPLAIARPDLTVVLVDSLARRTTFLSEVVDALGLTGRVTVIRGRAEELVGKVPPANVVTARAVAPLDRLAAWCLPLAVPGGRLLAIKGASAEEEAEVHAAAIHRLGGGTPVVHRCGEALLDEPVTVIEVTASRTQPPARRYRR